MQFEYDSITRAHEEWGIVVVEAIIDSSCGPETFFRVPQPEDSVLYEVNLQGVERTYGLRPQYNRFHRELLLYVEAMVFVGSGGGKVVTKTEVYCK